nr:unnamed protein product [Callosobruchus analis]
MTLESFLIAVQYWHDFLFVLEKKTPPPPSTIHLNDLAKFQSSSKDSRQDMTENKIQENGQWIIGDEDKESYDAFPQNGEEEENPPPAAPSDGQGGHGWSEAQQAELLQRRKRLK